MKNHKLLVLTAVTFTAVGCSSYRHPESIDAKMARFMPRDTNPNTVPKLPVPEIAHSSRTPASVGKENSSQIEDNSNEQENLSHKRLYFMGLYQQYRTLGSYISGEDIPEIQHCPSFHTTLLNGKTAYRGHSKNQIDFEQRYSSITEDKKSFYPELALPVETSPNSSTLAEVLNEEGLDKNVAFQQALKVHLTKTYKELEELCDSGSSSNFYNYENLTRHIKSNQGHYSQSTASLKTLVKTTIFSNMALIESLESSSHKSAARGPASASTAKKWENLYQEHMMKDLNVTWAKQYLKKAMTQR